LHGKSSACSLKPARWAVRHALSAHAWGEPVPRTVAAARRIAAKGERLLQRYRRIKQKT